MHVGVWLLDPQDGGKRSRVDPATGVARRSVPSPSGNFGTGCGIEDQFVVIRDDLHTRRGIDEIRKP